jgi:peptide/nickel transport system permease protein
MMVAPIEPGSEAGYEDSGGEPRLDVGTTALPRRGSVRAASVGIALARGVLELVVTMIVASFLVFSSLYLAPGSPLSVLTGGRTLSPEIMATLRAEYNLDDPFFYQYWAWLSDAFHGDFGVSIVSREPVSNLIAARAPTTLLLLTYAALLILVIGLGVGMLSATASRRTDRAVLGMTSIAMAIPPFVAAAALITVFAVQLRWFPVFGTGKGLLDSLHHLTLPALALSLAAIAYLARLTRTAVKQELTRDYVETARSRGLTRRVIMRRHVLRNASIPLVTAAGITVAGLIAGSVVVEQAFGLPGLGSLLVRSVEEKDFAVAQAVSLILVAAFIVINTLVDAVYVLLDPRLRRSGR